MCFSGDDRGAAEHQARDDAFGSKEKGERDYESGGDTFPVDRTPMDELEAEHHLGESDSDNEESG